MKQVILQNNAKLDIYEGNDKDTVILIIPGGGYCHLSTRESNPIKDKFLSYGYSCAILWYSVKNFINHAPLHEGNEALEVLSKQFKNIFVMGFSAGGHLAGLLSTDINSNLIKGTILGYPVITFSEKTHLMTRSTFLNNIITKENIEKYSIEKRVTKNTPSCFIFASITDETVPYENSLMMIEALKKNNVYVESKIFNSGVHGFALADKSAIKDGDEKYVNKECAAWPELADKFIKKVMQ